LKLVEEALDLTLLAAGPSRSAAARHVTVTAVTDSVEYVRWQETRLHVFFDVEAGWHIYGRPIPDGYTPVTVDVDAIPEVKAKPAEYPPPQPFTVEGLDEAFCVHEGRFEVRIPFAVNVPPGHGSIDLEARVRYQACSEMECLLPAELSIGLHLDEAAPA
jgi:DsbC/DsbD-like thiol-disulfide interchange protein